MPSLEEVFPKLLEEAFPGAIYRWKGEDYDIYEVVDPRGLLPIIVAQAKQTASVFESNILVNLDIQHSTDTLTGDLVVSDHSHTATLAIALPFLLDAVYLARCQQSESISPIINFDIIDPALDPSLMDALNNSPDEQKSPENFVLPE